MNLDTVTAICDFLGYRECIILNHKYHLYDYLCDRYPKILDNVPEYSIGWLYGEQVDLPHCRICNKIDDWVPNRGYCESCLLRWQCDHCGIMTDHTRGFRDNLHCMYMVREDPDRDVCGYEIKQGHPYRRAIDFYYDESKRVCITNRDGICYRRPECCTCNNYGDLRVSREYNDVVQHQCYDCYQEGGFDTTHNMYMTLRYRYVSICGHTQRINKNLSSYDDLMEYCRVDESMFDDDPEYSATRSEISEFDMEEDMINWRPRKYYISFYNDVDYQPYHMEIHGEDSFDNITLDETVVFQE